MNPIEKLWAKMKNEWSKALMKFDGETSDEKEDKVILKICELMEKYDMKKYINSVTPHLISSLELDNMIEI